eukprot:TRINITY_DN7406_c0_g1_i1.p2 TRINITY_DN7406_c0_g1~~TRINITY_DN7406_c0_g1_i1.p2  ORF type:complete len:792 (+),score=338.54 TRINITY_DN7406_c0_g1_i1:46-2421(+)
MGMHAIVAAAAAAAVGASPLDGLNFRPPAIPLFTTDPFMQTWMRGDNATAAQVTHWDGAEKQMAGLIRVDGQTHQWLGACTPQPRTAPGPLTAGPLMGTDIAPGAHDVGSFADAGADNCNVRCYNAPQCVAFVRRGGRCWLKSAAGPAVPSLGATAYVIDAAAKPACATRGLRQKRVSALPTRTVFELELPGVLAVNATFLQTMFTEDYVRLSRPVYYLHVDVAVLDGRPHDVALYFDATAQHAVNAFNQKVRWSSWNDRGAGFEGVQIGNAAQKVLGSKGDFVNIDWGYLHLAKPAGDAATTLWAGSAAAARDAFAQRGALPAAADTRQPRAVQDDTPALATAHVFAFDAATAAASHTIMLAYDDVKSVYFFGDELTALWQRNYTDIQHAIAAAHAERAAMLAKSEAHDAALVASYAAKTGAKYAALLALSYRQTLAATKLVWNDRRNATWNFLKEISTNGDMQTMDVIYPASPMLIHTQPDLLKLLLLPVLAYAHNETAVKFGDPYSPHQLGVYPIANATTAQQEAMPLENSGNMMLMLLALIQRGTARDASFVAPFFAMLKGWADELVRTTEFPANQICTDDFTGPLPNNTNLGAKGIVAIAAFAEICGTPGAGNDDGAVACGVYTDAAKQYAATWMKYARADGPMPHAKMSFNDVPGVEDSWSLKYNLLWQQLLGLDGPFPWAAVVEPEVAYYKAKANAYGIPMDPRHTYVKTDWLSWAAAMASTVAAPGDGDRDFHFIADPIFKYCNETASRDPFTDLYRTDTGVQDRGGFIARPVIGGLFARMLL